MLFDNSILNTNSLLHISREQCARKNACEKTTRNDVIVMIENMNETNANDVVTNENNDDATTTTTTRVRASRARTTRANVVETNDDNTRRATTRALRDVRMNKNDKTKIIRDDANNEIVVVRTSTNALRIDHSNCAHANDKNARSKCRASIARANDKKTK